jgi:hypothetical protein
VPFGQPRCVGVSKRNFNINNGPNRFVYPSCCADRSDAHTMTWRTIEVDDVKPTVHNSNKCSSYVQNTGWVGIGASKTLAYQAQGTGYNEARKTSCSSLNGITGAECREMHGPYLKSTEFAIKQFDIATVHESIKVGVRVWANDMWQSESGPVVVEVLANISGTNTVIASKSLDRTKELECDSNWDTYYNQVSIFSFSYLCCVISFS